MLVSLNRKRSRPVHLLTKNIPLGRVFFSSSSFSGQGFQLNIEVNKYTVYMIFDNQFLFDCSFQVEKSNAIE
jgi:hypothetical protein